MLRTVFKRLQNITKNEILTSRLPLVATPRLFHSLDRITSKKCAKRVLSCPKLAIVNRYYRREHRPDWGTNNKNCESEETESIGEKSLYVSAKPVNLNDQLEPELRYNKNEFAFDVFEQIKSNANAEESLDHLQPSNICPFNSTNIPNFPSTVKISTLHDGGVKVPHEENIPLRRGYSKFGEDNFCPYYKLHRSLKDRISAHPLCFDDNENKNKVTSCLIKPWPSFSETISNQKPNEEVSNFEEDSIKEAPIVEDIKSISESYLDEDEDVKSNYRPPSQSLSKVSAWSKDTEFNQKHNENESNFSLKNSLERCLPPLVPPTKSCVLQPWASYSDILKASMKNDNSNAFDVQDETNMHETENFDVEAEENVNKTKNMKTEDENTTCLSLAPIQSLPEVTPRRLLGKKFDHIYNSSSFKTKSIKQYKRNIVTTPVYLKKKKKCDPKPKKRDPCDDPPKKPKKCFLPSKVRLPPYLKCAPFPKPCPKPEPCVRADDFLCVKPRPLREMEVSDCICHEPYMPTKAPKMKRLKFRAPDPPRVCPKPPCPQPRADDNMHVPKKMLKILLSKDCDCTEPEPLKDVPLVRLKKVCPPEVCRPKRVCPKEQCPPRADEFLKPKKKHLPTLHATVCPCIEDTFKDVPPIKRLNLKFPEQPRPCPPPEPCVRADDTLVTRPKFLPFLSAKDCPCEEKKMVDVNFKRLKCREYEKPCYTEDPCKVYPPRADMGCWEYYVAKIPKPCKKHKLKCKRKKKKCECE